MGFANAGLPSTDYRVGFARETRVADVFLALPERPPGFDPGRFVSLGVNEGFSIRSALNLLRVPALLRRWQIDVAHFFASQFILVGPLLARSVGVRSVITVTGIGRSFGSTSAGGRVASRAYRAMFRVSAALSEAVLFQNQSDLATLEGAVSRRHLAKLRVIGSAVDPRPFAASMPEKEPVDTQPVVLMVARVQELKGVDDFLTVAAQIGARADFVLIGPPSLGEDLLLRRVDDAASRGVIRYLGRLPDSDVRAWYERASLVMLPSRTEGMPRVVIEASLAQRAVLAYDIPGCRAVLPDEALVPAFDGEALRSLTVRALDSWSFRLGLAHDAHVRALEEFALSAYVDRLDDILSRAGVEGGGTSGPHQASNAKSGSKHGHR